MTWLLYLTVLGLAIYSERVTAAEICPLRWTYIGGVCVKAFHDDFKNWDDARADCKRYDGDLIKVDSNDKTSLVKELLRNESNYWIGVRRVNGVFNLLDDHRDVTRWYTNWRNGVSNSGGCVEVRGSSDFWDNSDCSVKRSYICEIEFADEGGDNRCKPKWSYSVDSDSCVRVMTDGPMVGWDQARKICESEGGDLLRADSGHKTDFLRELDDPYQNGLWIGLHKVDGRFIWTHEPHSVSYVNWQPGKPDNVARVEDCAEVFIPNGKVNDIRCNAARHFACEMASVTTCRAGWTYQLETKSCVLVSTAGSMTWQQSRAVCQLYGGDLMKVDGDIKTNIIRGMYKQGPGAWIGVYKAEGQFHVVGKSQALTYLGWADNQPSRNQNCVQASSSTADWNDMYCGYNRDYVCETEMPEQGPCLSGWIFSESSKSCVKIMTEHGKITWQASLAICQKHRGSLMKVDSFLKTNLIQKIYNPYHGRLWISLRRHNNDFKWLGEDEKITYSHWETGQPSNQNGMEWCVEVHTDGAYWNDVRCDEQNNFICEINLSNPTH